MIKLAEKNKYDLINVMKFISSILVVAIHTVSKQQYLGYFILVTSRIAVPFFFYAMDIFYVINYMKKIYVKERRKYINI